MIAPETARLVRDRASGFCEYCRVSEADSDLSFHIEHIRAKVHGGSDQADNLAFSCPPRLGIASEKVTPLRRSGASPTLFRIFLNESGGLICVAPFLLFTKEKATMETRLAHLDCVLDWPARHERRSQPNNDSWASYRRFAQTV